jgi:nucleotide-binding universal stress UspA family protein
MEKDIYPKMIEKARFDAEVEFTNHYSEENKGNVIAVTGRKASDEIINRSKHGYELIIIGTKGEHRHFLSGGTSEQVVRHSHIPVISVPPDSQTMEFKRIIVPTDGSVLSLQVLPLALQLAHSFGARISLLHILELYGSIAEDVYIYQGETEIDAIKEGLFEKTHDYLIKSYGPRIQVTETDYGLQVSWNVGADHFVVEAEIEITKSVSAQYEIVDRSEQDADLIAMTTHGRSGLAHILLGSTTEKVVRHSKVPVLTIKPEHMIAK